MAILEISLNACLCPNATDELQFGLEVDIVRQLDVLDKTGGLYVVTMRENKFLVLRRCANICLLYTSDAADE